MTRQCCPRRVNLHRGEPLHRPSVMKHPGGGAVRGANAGVVTGQGSRGGDALVTSPPKPAGHDDRAEHRQEDHAALPPPPVNSESRMRKPRTASAMVEQDKTKIRPLRIASRGTQFCQPFANATPSLM